jgi:hypothetical protein
MAENIPPPWFAKQATDDAADAEFKRRRDALLKELPRLSERRKGRGRAEQFLPYLLVRSVLGDRGDRPVNVPFWESPDIWTAEGAPADTPNVPPDHGGSVTAGNPATVYAHVWNLGFAPLTGIRVEFYWFDPSVGITGNFANLIGMARCELSGRGMPGSHALVKCPEAWTPSVVNGGHECLVVRVSGIGDPIGANEWQPWLNRHVAQRNIAVVSTGASVSHLLANLNASRRLNTRLQLLQIGPQEGELARAIAVPKARLMKVDTQVLGELNVGNEIRRVARDAVPTAAFAPVHPMAAGIDHAPPRLPTEGMGVFVEPTKLFGALHLTGRERESIAERLKLAESRSPKGGHLADLVAGARRLHGDAELARAPARGEAQVIRVANYNGEQLVGGYTLVVAGR